MDNLQTSKGDSKYQPTAVQLAFPWGEEEIIYSYPQPSTKRGSQKKTSRKKKAGLLDSSGYL